MNKAILISIQPQHVVNILNGIKTLELRKSVPKDFEGWVYIYCTKAKPYLSSMGKEFYETSNIQHFGCMDVNGKVVAKFWLDQYIKIVAYEYKNKAKLGYPLPQSLFNELQLNQNEIDDYGKGKNLYAWHIKQLTIFDKPLEMCQFKVKVDNYSELNDPSPFYVRVERAPQSYMYVRELL